MTTGHENYAKTESVSVRKMLVVLAGALFAALILAIPAWAAVVAPVPPHSVISFPQRDFVSADGYNPGEHATVNVIRNGVTIGTSTDITAQADPKDPTNGIIEVNHPGGGCWVGTTPDILPGDQVVVNTAASGAEGTTTANVTAGRPVVEGGVLTVHGTADDITQPGLQPLPLGQIEQRLINPNLTTGKNARSLRAPGDGTIRYDAPGSVNWTAKYPNAGADVASGVATSPDTESRILWLGPNPAVGNQLTIFENGNTVAPGPAAPCTAPLARTAITSFDRTVVNIANVGKLMVVAGVAQAEATGVSVSVPGGVPHAGTLTTAPSGQQTWKATIPAAELGKLPQGSFLVTANFTGPGVPASHRKALRKDTVAPRAPTATPKAGTYTRAQSVSLEAQAGTKIRFTQNGTTPTLNSRVFVNPIRVNATQTIKAIAVDSASNRSSVASFRYVIR